MRPYENKKWLVSLVIVCLGAVATVSYAGDWEFYHYYELFGMPKQTDVKVYLKVGKHQKGGIIPLLVKDVALDKDSEGCQWLTTLREYCMAQTCTGDYAGSKKKGIPVKERITSYIIDCAQGKYSTLGTAWYGFDGSSLGRSYWNPPPQRPGSDFPSEQDKTEAQLRKILTYVCNQYNQ